MILVPVMTKGCPGAEQLLATSFANHKALLAKMSQKVVHSKQSKPLGTSRLRQ